MTFDNYVFRCSGLGKLMTKPRNKGDVLSESTKEYLRELWLEHSFGRKKDTSSKYTDKGLYTEEDALALMQDYAGRFLVKNTKGYRNEYIIGTPDVVLDDRVMDAKSSWDIYTFFAADGSNKDYYWQGLGYMALTGKTRFDLCYCLNNAPEHMIVAEKSRRQYQKMYPEGSEELAKMEAEVERQMTFDDLHRESRIKVFTFTYDEADYDRLVNKIGHARNYMNSLKF